MSETKHTPGPWMVRHAYNVMAGRRSVATCGGYSSNVPGEDSHGENVANAHLVAAAPDLLAMLEKWSALFPGGQTGSPEFVQLIIDTRAAIAAAKGD